MGNTCSSIGAGPLSASQLQGAQPSDENEERKFPPPSDADSQLAIVLQNRAVNEASGTCPDCLGASTSQAQPRPRPQPTSGVDVRSQLLVQVQNLGQQLLQFLPYRDLSVLATTSGRFCALISQQPELLRALALHDHLVSPLADLVLLAKAGKEMRGFVREEQALLEKVEALLNRSGWPLRSVVKVMSELSPQRFASFAEIDLLLRKAESGAISQQKHRWLCFALSDVEPPALVEEAIAVARQGNTDALKDLIMRTGMRYCVREVHDLAERSTALKAQEHKLSLLPKYSTAYMKAKYAHLKERDAIHQLSDTERSQLEALAAGLSALTNQDPRPPGLLGNILNAMQRIEDREPARSGKIQTARLLAMGFEHELHDHLVECDEWLRLCSTEPIDVGGMDLHQVRMACGRAGLPASTVETISQALKHAHHDKGAALRVRLNVLHKALLEVAKASLIEHYVVESNPTVSFSSSPAPLSALVENAFSFAYVDPLTGKQYPAQSYAHVGHAPFAKKFFVTNEQGEVIHVRTHLFNAKPRRAQGGQRVPGVGDAQVVMHLGESKADRQAGV